MAWAVVTVASGGLPVTESTNGFGRPIEEAPNGFGTAVTFVTNGAPVVWGGEMALPSPSFALIADGDQAYLRDSDGAYFMEPI